MSRTDQSDCRGIWLGETANAIHVGHPTNGESWWIPRSQIGYLRRENQDEVIFTCPEWLVEKKQMWGLVS